MLGGGIGDKGPNSKPAKLLDAIRFIHNEFGTASGTVFDDKNIIGYLSAHYVCGHFSG